MPRLCRFGLFTAAACLTVLFLLPSCTSRFRSTLKALPPPLNESGLELTEFDSALLGKKMAVYVYLPPDYRPDRTYPVLYLFHGFGNSETEWFDYHKLNETADRLIADGKIKPLVIACPRMDNSWRIDSGDCRILGPVARKALYAGPYETYFLNEVVRLVEDRYRVARNPEGRFIGGISMGGFAALHIGFRHPDLFGKIGGHSPALKGNLIPDFFLYTKKQKRSAYDPLILARRRDLSAVRIFIDCGEQDSLYPGAVELRDILENRKLRVTFFSAPGTHSSEYWHANLERYLLFYAGTGQNQQ